ncbi:lipoprotein [Mycoplasma capricolum subsp. capricolum]|uniref:lipoprotein n=1 Tax=Mycoplasma capricolum TaxID=2095 RepID=UPI003DA433F7
MKKLLTLLGSVGLVASTSAIAVACENKIPAISLSTDKNGVKEKSDDQPKEKSLNQPFEKTKSEERADQSNLKESADQTKEKEIEKAEHALKEADDKAKLAKKRYRKALEEAEKHKKGDALYNQTIDELDASQNDVMKAEEDLKNAQEKVNKLKNNKNT